MPISESIVYILHFRKKHFHSQHYIGFCEKLKPNLYNRMEKHWKGKSGVALMRTLKEKGIDFTVAKIWVGADREFERRLKNKKKSSMFCPICRQEYYLPKTIPWFDPKDFIMSGHEAFVIEGELIHIKNS